MMLPTGCLSVAVGPDGCALRLQDLTGPVACQACGATVTPRSREDLVAENARLHAALARIADAESGPWGQIAHNALHPEREAA